MMKPLFLTPDILRDAAGYLSPEAGNPFLGHTYTCWAVDRATGGEFGDSSATLEYQGLLHDMGALSQERHVLPIWELPGEEQQSIRFMFLHFLANYLEDQS